jgi:hypothetical protein
MRIFFLIPILLSASEIPRLSLAELVKLSDTIVAGRAHPSVVVSEPGGTLNGVSLIVPGSTPYTVGEEVSVFLYRTPIGYLRTTNYGQGKFVISDTRSWSDFHSRIVRIVASHQEAPR